MTRLTRRVISLSREIARIWIAVCLVGLAIGQAQTIRVNCGSFSSYTDSSGNVWSADYGYNTGASYSTGASISNTSIPGVYTSERYSYAPLTYYFPVANGNYTVTLRFAEISIETTGQRLFTINVNGVQIENGSFDVYNRAGGPNIATNLALITNVSGGQGVTITLTPQASSATISAIEIVPSDGTLSYFSDVTPDDPNFSYVQFMKDKGVTSGCASINAGRNMIYCGGWTLTRGQMAVFVVRALYWALTGNVEGQTALNSSFTYSPTPYFTDVPVTDSFFKYIQKLKEVGVTSGTSLTTYGPGDPLTNGQVAVFSTRTWEWHQQGRSLASPQYNAVQCFQDVTSGHSFFQFIYKMHLQQVVTGNCQSPNGVFFLPDAAVSRSMMAKFIVRGALGLVNPGSGGGGGGGGGTGSASREYIRANGRLIAIESSSSSGGSGGAFGLMPFQIRPSAVNFGPAGGGSMTFEVADSTPVTWSIIPNIRSDIGSNQGTKTDLPNGKVQYNAPASIPGGVNCPIGSTTGNGATCVYTLSMEARSIADPSKKSYGTITLTPPDQTVILSPVSSSWNGTGGNGSFNVQANAGVNWASTTGFSWIQITWGFSGTGPGTVYFTVQSNPNTTARTGTITVNGVVHTIQQAGSIPGGNSPLIESVTPNTGSSSTATYTIVASDPNGYADLREVRFTVGLNPTSGARCIVSFTYDPYYGGSRFYLRDSAGSNDQQYYGWDIYNPYCILRYGTTAQIYNNKLYVYIALTFRSGFNGSRNLYASATDASFQTNGNQQFGTWSVPVTQSAPELTWSTVYQYGGNPQTFQMNIRDWDNNLTQIRALVWDDFTGSNCQVQYTLNPYGQDEIRLFGGTGGIWDPETATPGQAVVLQSSNCRVYAQWTSVIETDANVLLNLRVEWFEQPTRNRSVQVWATDATNYTYGWQVLNYWYVP